MPHMARDTTAQQRTGMCTVVLMALSKRRTHRPPAMPDFDALDPDEALSLLRSSAWHPETVAAMLRHVIDWLHDSHQFDAAAHLSAISVTHPVAGTPTTVPELIGAERSAMRRQESARRQAVRNVKLEEWRAGGS